MKTRMGPDDILIEAWKCLGEIGWIWLRWHSDKGWKALEKFVGSMFLKKIVKENVEWMEKCYGTYNAIY